MFHLSRKFVTVNNRLVRSASGFTKVGVVGLGLMGHGVAQVAAQAGFQVIAVESDKKAMEMGMKRINGSLNRVMTRDLKAGKIPTEAVAKAKYEEIMTRIHPTTEILDAADCDVIIEALPEVESVKIDFYKSLSHLASEKTIFASNTSSLAITNMALASGRPKQFVGLHFFNPVQMMKLVEVIRSEHTDMTVFNRMLEFGKELGKDTVSCKDTPGFIVNRLLIPYLSQAMAMVDRQDASIEDIDTSMMLGAGHPMGPLQLADYVGLDVCWAVLKGWQKAYPEEKSFVIPKCLEEKAMKGEYGRKTEKGFYIWDSDKIVRPNI